jgi:hypothetical protein
MSNSIRILFSSKIVMFITALYFVFDCGMLSQAEAHSGGTDSQGCHNDRQNGGYHCHAQRQATYISPRQQVETQSYQTAETYYKQAKPLYSNQATPLYSNSFYPNCSTARAAGAAPIYRGQAGYASHLDRDNDGVACE